MLVCFSLCLIMGICIPVSVQAAVCNHSNIKINNGRATIAPCVYQNYTEGVCKDCNNRTFYTLVGEQKTEHKYTVSTDPYETYDGRIVTVTKYTCTNCGHAYSTSSVS